MSFHVCVWIDHRTAKLFQISAHEAAVTEVEDQRPPHHIHRSTDHLGLGTVPLDRQMMAEVGEQLRDAEAILLAGPGQAKFELRNYLQLSEPAVAARIWGIEPSDHPTDPQLVAWARDWFRAQDRMHETRTSKTSR